MQSNIAEVNSRIKEIDIRRVNTSKYMVLYYFNLFRNKIIKETINTGITIITTHNIFKFSKLIKTVRNNAKNITRYTNLVYRRGFSS